MKVQISVLEVAAAACLIVLLVAPSHTALRSPRGTLFDGAPFEVSRAGYSMAHNFGRAVDLITEQANIKGHNRDLNGVTRAAAELLAELELVDLEPVEARQSKLKKQLLDEEVESMDGEQSELETMARLKLDREKVEQERSARERLHRLRESKESFEAIKGLPTFLNECNFNGYVGLAKLHRLITGFLINPSDLVHSAILEAIRAHSDNCRDKYLNMYETASSELDSNQREKVDRVLDQDFLAKFYSESETLIDALKARDFLLRFKNSAQVLNENVIKLMIDKGQLPQESAKFVWLMDVLNDFNNKQEDRLELARRRSLQFCRSRLLEYLFIPCQEYANKLKDIFQPARLDLSPDETKLIEINPNGDHQFKQSWRKFRVCDSVARNRDELVQISCQQPKL